jgi:hypothetical protein
MTTRTDEPRESVRATTVADLPPLTVTTEGIPPTEHLQEPSTGTAREPRTRWYALAFMGVLATIAVLALVWNALFWAPAPVPTAAPTLYAGWGELGSPVSEWPPRLTPSQDGLAQWGATISEWPPRLTPSRDGYAQWGSTMSEWPPAPWSGPAEPTSVWPPSL